MHYSDSQNKTEQKRIKNNNYISPASQLKQVVSIMAIENMYFSDGFIDQLIKVANGELSSEELRQEIIKEYTRK